MPTIEQILSDIVQRLDRIEAALVVKSGPYAGTPVKPGMPTADPAKVAETKALLADLGTYAPGDSLITLWLQRYSPAEINAAIRRLLAPMPGASAEEQAYNFSVKAHAGGGWKNVFPELAGEPTGPIVNPDPESNLLAGLPHVTGPADLELAAVNALARAERGVTWRGNVALAPTELAIAKDVLADLSRWRPEWRGWVDGDLLRVLVLTNVLPLAPAPFQPYPETSDYAVETLPEWLYGQWVGSRS